MKVVITKHQELVSPKLEMYFDLENNHVSVRLISTCSECSGYGCNTHRHNNDYCKSGRLIEKLNPEDLVDTLGPDFKNIFQKLSDQVLSKKL